MAATSMMKEYVKRQLKYWVDNFKDDQLPRDFHAKGFSRASITLHKITLKPDKIAALLRVPPPLIVTRATCSELVLKLPSWQLAETFVQEPLSLRLGDLFLDVKHLDECDDRVRRESLARARAASLEPDPLGSIASMYQFAMIISERLDVFVENVYLKVYERHALRLCVELSRFHARTTNALWQDMRDLSDCVDRSPDGLLQTRFKFVSATCSVYLHEAADDAASGGGQQTPPPLRLLRDHAIAMRMTLFGHRRRKSDAWATLSRVVDLNLETLPFEMDVCQLRQVYDAYATLAKWMRDVTAACAGGDDDGTTSTLLPHELVRGPLTPKHKPVTGDAAKEAADDEPAEAAAGNTFALQVTVRFTAHALVKFRSERRGDLLLAVIAQHAAVNWIQHADAATETQVTVHDLSVRHKDKVLFHVKPAREALTIRRLAGGAVFLKWHLQRLACQLEGEIAAVANEIFHSFNEIEQAAAITCGTCHHKIRLDAIATHVCSAAAAAAPPAAPPASPTVAHGSRSNSGTPTASSAATPDERPLLDSTQIPKLRLVFALDELEFVADSFLFRSVQELMRLATEPTPVPQRRFVVSLKDWSVSTESKEFVGDAIFVPVLPLAFQMLECTIRGCGCVQRLQRRQRGRRTSTPSPTSDSESATGADACACASARQRPRWPDRVFAELGHLSIKSVHNATNAETFVVADGSSLRLSFSDGVQICSQSAPQMSCFFHVQRIRCQLEHCMYARVRRALATLQDPLEGRAVSALTLFFAVLEIRNVELTLLQEEDKKGDAAIPTTAGARVKAQFRHVGGVADNHQGHLSLQTNFDFRALLQSESVRFAFAASEAPPENGEASEGGAYETKRERRRRREDALREDAAARIQRSVRRFAAARRKQWALELRRLTREDEEGAEADNTAAVRSESGGTDRVASQRDSEASSSAASTSSKRRKSSGKSALFGGSAEDLAAINPMKMVAAAGVLKDGVMGFVKAKGQRLESEMTELALQSKESASRFMPKYSAMKNLLSPRAASGQQDAAAKHAEVRVVEAENGDGEKDAAGMADGQANGGSGETVATTAEDDNVVAQSDHDGEYERSDTGSGDDEDGQHGDAVDCEGEDCAEEEGEDRQEEAQADEEQANEQEAIGDLRDEEEAAPEEKAEAPPLSAAETLLASLPPIVRIMVQVEEHRLCVPVDPRSPVAMLCREIVRRFNEMFATRGVIVHVTLQNPQGGVFAGSDIVGLICDTTRNDLFFAYPHEPDGEIKSVVHIHPSGEPRSPSKDGGAGSTADSFHSAKTKTTQKKSGCEFSRCSKMPLPLVVALLANESERDLLRHVMKDGSYGGGAGRADEWPELALNASFLDPVREMLQVEVRWQGQSLEVSNGDAFLLCLQQLGLCTTRANSKYVGKILRDRLKMDTKNPLIRAACAASADFCAASGGDAAATSYEKLKDIVQEDFGVYMRPKD